jgi:hypothetical protein
MEATSNTDVKLDAALEDLATLPYSSEGRVSPTVLRYQW